MEVGVAVTPDLGFADPRTLPASKQQRSANRALGVSSSSSQMFQASGIRGGFLPLSQPSPLDASNGDDSNDEGPTPTPDDPADDLERRMNAELDALFHYRRARVERRLAERRMDLHLGLDIRDQDGQIVAVAETSNELQAPTPVADASTQTEPVFNPGWSLDRQQGAESCETGWSSDEVSPSTAQPRRSRLGRAEHGASGTDDQRREQQAALRGPPGASALPHVQANNEIEHPIDHQILSNMPVPEWAWPQIDQHDAGTTRTNFPETARRPSSQAPLSQRNLDTNMVPRPLAIARRVPFIEDVDEPLEEAR